MSVDIAVNPFPARAVSTYGVTSPNLELEYATTAYRHLERYLLWYHDSRRSHAGAIGISGEFGEGKTHLLNWLAEQARRGEPTPSVIYGKADTSSLFDVYKQLMREVPREMLIRLIGLASLAIARKQVEAAVATQAVGSRIRDYSDLERLFEEGNVDRIAVGNELRAQVIGTDDIQKPIPTMLLAVTDSQRGESAYRWLLGNSIDDLSAFGLSHDLKNAAGGTDSLLDPDAAAIDALESVATLHRSAGVPFIVLVDQLESLVAQTSERRREQMFSLFKKLIEQLARQEALIYIAGTPEGWAPFRRDSIDRLYTRPPIAVGHLDRNETAALLDAHLEGPSQSRAGAFSPEAIDTFYGISGGNMREILQTAYEAFEIVQGCVEKATRDDVIAAARLSGSLEDRRTLALSIADEVLERYGVVRTAIGLLGRSGERWTVDRMLSKDGRTSLALFTICAADRASEARLSLQVTEVIEYLNTEYPGIGIVVTMIGYVSSEVTSLLETVAAIIPFQSDDFAGRLESRVERMLSSEDDDKAVVASPDIKPVLNVIEQKRALEQDAVAERFNKSVSSIHEPERQRHKARTAWDVIEDLDRLRELVQSGAPASEEREIIQALSTWNSLGKGDARIEKLAGLYLELVSMSLSARALPGMSERIDSERLELRTTLRNMVRGEGTISSTLRRFLHRPSVYVGYLIAVVAIFLVQADLTKPRLTVYKFTPPLLYGLFESPSAYIPAWGTLFAMLYLGAVAFAWSYLTDPVRIWERRVRATNRALDAALAGERDRYS